MHTSYRLNTLGDTVSHRTYPQPPTKSSNTLGRLNIAIVTNEFDTLDDSGYFGRYFREIASELAESGHDVTVFMTRRLAYKIERMEGETTKRYSSNGSVTILYVDAPSPKVVNGPSGDALRAIYSVYDALLNSEQEYDFIHYPDSNGFLYFCLQAKKVGLSFLKTTFVAHALRPLLWQQIINAEPIVQLEKLIRIFVERKNVELADYVVSGSPYMFDWMIGQGYSIDEQASFVKRRPVKKTISNPAKKGLIKDNELSVAYIGEIVAGHGAHIFLDAVNRLCNTTELKNIKVTIYGRLNPLHDLKSAIRKLGRRKNVSLEWIKWTSAKKLDALLASNSVDLVCMPFIGNDLSDNYFKVLESGIPVIATRDQSLGFYKNHFLNLTLCGNTPPELLIGILEFIEQSTSNQSTDALTTMPAADSTPGWAEIHAGMSFSPASNPSPAALQPTKPPLVSVCIAHHNRGALLERAVRSVMKQDYDNIEVVVIDDGSTDAKALNKLKELERQSFRFPFKVARQTNKYLGAVRNTGVRNSSGEFILFMDDDNEAMPFEVSEFVKVATHTKGDIFTCFSDVFAGKSPEESSIPRRRILYHGENLAAALLRNPYGDSNCFVRRDAILQIDGFSEHYKVGLDDMEFFSRAIVSGLSVTVIPKALYWYRINETRMRHSQYNLFAGRYRVTNGMTQNMPPDIANVFYYATSMGDKHGPNGTSSKRKLPVKVMEFARRAVHKFPVVGPLARAIVYRFF